MAEAPMKPDPLRDLPPNARDALLYLADRIREGFTGTIRVECLEGGVRRVSAEDHMSAEDLARYRMGRVS